jgi:serine/threonine protein kinase
MTANELPSTTSWQRLSPGTRLNDTYEIDQQIGVGGMGEVYKGHVVETGDLVAIKLMLPELAQNEAALTLFRKEASALHRVHHDAVVHYYVFTFERVLRRHFLAFEFVDGRTLSNILHDNGPLPFEAVRSLMQRLASGLQAAHELGIVHRDVSPDNIIIPNSDVTRAKIIDFGIAKSNQHGTVIGSGFAGKFSYVSPEQLGLFGGNVTAKSDIYSLGLVLVEALAGRPLDMGGSQLEVIEKRRKVPALGAIDMRIRPLLEKMLQPDPDQRPASMAAVAAWSIGSTGSPRPARDNQKSADRGTPKNRAWRNWGRAAAVLFLIAGCGAGLFYFSTIQPPVAPPPPTDGPPSPSPSPPPHGVSVEKIRNYVENYNGGSCFLVTPVVIRDDQALLDGLGSSPTPFNAFDEDFGRSLGFDATISLRQVTEQQCPAVTFLAQLRGEIARAPHLDIDQTHLRIGDRLRGLVDHYSSASNVNLLLVSDAGRVQNWSSELKPGTGAQTFDIPIVRPEGVAGSQPQLLIALASPSPIDPLRSGSPSEAEQFFPQVLSDAARSGKLLSATARYFTLEK